MSAPRAAGSSGSASPSPRSLLFGVAPSMLSDFRLDLLGQVPAASPWSPSGSAWPGAAAGCSCSARACSSASAATSWRCTSSSPTPAAADGVPDFMQLYGDGTVPGWWEPFRVPVVTIAGDPRAARAGRRAARPRACSSAGSGRLLRDPVAGARRGVRDPAHRPADGHGRHQRAQRVPRRSSASTCPTRSTSRCCTSSPPACCSSMVAVVPASSWTAATASCWSPCRDQEERVRFLGYDPAQRQGRRLHRSPRSSRASPARSSSRSSASSRPPTSASSRRSASSSAWRSAGGPPCSGRCSAPSAWPGPRPRCPRRSRRAGPTSRALLFIVVVAFLPGGLASAGRGVAGSRELRARPRARRPEPPDPARARSRIRPRRRGRWTPRRAGDAGMRHARLPRVRGLHGRLRRLRRRRRASTSRAPRATCGSSSDRTAPARPR